VLNKPILKNISGFINLFSRLTDPLVVLVAAYFAFNLKFSDYFDVVPKDYKLLMLFVFFCVMVVFPWFDLYSSWRGQSLLKQAKSIFFAWFSVIVIVIVILFGFKLSAGYSRLWLGFWAISGLVFLLLFRTLIYLFLQRQRRRGRNLRKVIVVGAGDLGARAIMETSKASWMGYRVIAVFDDAKELKNVKVGGSLVVGNIDDVGDYLKEHNVDEIWLALPLRAELRMRQLLDDISHHVINVKLIPDIFGFSLLHHSMTEIAGMPAVNLSVSPLDGSNRLVKEAEDRILALLILILVSPLMFFIAIGVKLSSPGPVLFKQERVSWNGKKFKILKFRSMPLNDDKSSEWGNVKEKKVTSFGSFLRKTSLDELPQFLNVFFGDMSIVGPRPERSEFVDKFKYEIPGYMQKHMVKAGITGWAQINGWRGDTCLKTRIEYDLYYIENWSLWFDLKIILLTFLKGFLNKNAY